MSIALGSMVSNHRENISVFPCTSFVLGHVGIWRLILNIWHFILKTHEM